MTNSPLSQSSVEWIDEAMAHNNAHDGEVWMRQRTREARGCCCLDDGHEGECAQ